MEHIELEHIEFYGYGTSLEYSRGGAEVLKINDKNLVLSLSGLADHLATAVICLISALHLIESNARTEVHLLQAKRLFIDEFADRMLTQFNPLEIRRTNEVVQNESLSVSFKVERLWTLLDEFNPEGNQNTLHFYASSNIKSEALFVVEVMNDIALICSKCPDPVAAYAPFVEVASDMMNRHPDVSARIQNRGRPKSALYPRNGEVNAFN